MAKSSHKTGVFLEAVGRTRGPHSPSSEEAAARNILNRALESVLPESAMIRYVKMDESTNTLKVAGREYSLDHFDKVFIVGGGKAARHTGAALVKILGDRITAGILNVYRDQAKDPISDHIELFAADHPTPNEEGAEGAKKMVEFLKRADENTLVIALLSGGGSSLMVLPVEGISLDEYKAVTQLLLSVPATIDQINSVRKHLDSLKGGGMRKCAERAGGFISLVISDVPVTKTGVADDPSVIASGPTVGDDSTFEMAQEVLVEYDLWDRVPLAVRKYIEANLGKEDYETLRKDSLLLNEEKSQYLIIADNDHAMEAAKERAEQFGYKAHMIGCKTGTTEDKIKAEVTQEIENIWKVITGYSTENDHITFASFSTDGVDGNADVAGAIADQDTLELGRNKGLDYHSFLANYDSATFFKKLGLAIAPGPTGTNVADIVLVLITNPNDPYRKIALIFGGEATVKIQLPEGQGPGSGGRNTHLALLAAQKLAGLSTSRGRMDRESS